MHVKNTNQFFVKFLGQWWVKWIKFPNGFEKNLPLNQHEKLNWKKRDRKNYRVFQIIASPIYCNSILETDRKDKERVAVLATFTDIDIKWFSPKNVPSSWISKWPFLKVWFLKFLQYMVGREHYAMVEHNGPVCTRSGFCFPWYGF